jgi:hypothetical protein
MALRILLGLVGAVLLLPGLCSAGFVVWILPDILHGRNLGDIRYYFIFWVFGFGLAWGGFVLLRKVIRGGMR